MNRSFQFKTLNTKGFTLVELAIVLVIIGLIIGGVLVGRDLIEQAKLKKQIDVFIDLERAVNTFRLKYNSLPGDFNNATAFFPDTIIANGNNNTVIYCGGELNTTAMAGECKQFWNHLYITGLFTNGVSPSAAGQVMGSDFPVNPINSTAMVALTAPYNPSWSGSYVPSSIPYGIYAWLNITTDISTNINSASKRAWTSKHAFMVDKKIDDGNALTGRFFAPVGFSNSYGGYVSGSWSYNSYCNDSAGVYRSVGEDTCSVSVCQTETKGPERCYLVYNFYKY